MLETQKTKKYDLEDRTQKFARSIIVFVRQMHRDIPSVEIMKQVVRSAGSVGANYIEANESLGKKDFLMRIRISKKEAKETRYWLQLLEPKDKSEQDALQALIQEVEELMRIFGAILVKSTKS